MSYSCSQCDFTSQFESALKMHQELHHEKVQDNIMDTTNSSTSMKNSNPIRTSSPLPDSLYSSSKHKGFKLPSRNSSATRLFDKLRARIQRSRSSLFAHPEENAGTYEVSSNDTTADLMCEGTPKTPSKKRLTGLSALKETYSCHLCNFDADRITVLDRHLLNDHKIGLDNLLKLVMAKTREGLTEANGTPQIGKRQPYYMAMGNSMGEGEFVIQTVTPKMRILKNTATNTDIKWTDIPDVTDNYKMITKELKKFMNPSEKYDKEDFVKKMETLDEYMCRFLDTSNTLKKTLKKEIRSKCTVRDRLNIDPPLFTSSVGEPDTGRDWERCHSEKAGRSRSTYDGNDRDDKKLVAESFYF